jgi:hypothetical protein
MFEEPEYLGPVSLPGEPTDALPGSEQKIRIMTERATRHEQLFHPQDGLVCKDRARRPRTAEVLAWPVPSADPAAARPEAAALPNEQTCLPFQEPAGHAHAAAVAASG